ncbi:MAG: hypothetical protein K9H62_13915 [Bacteroidales bacterium]|nr:hypothetical protein [Bacteroidales bacterium]
MNRDSFEFESNKSPNNITLVSGKRKTSYLLPSILKPEFWVNQVSPPSEELAVFNELKTEHISGIIAEYPFSDLNTILYNFKTTSSINISSLHALVIAGAFVFEVTNNKTLGKFVGKQKGS